MSAPWLAAILLSLAAEDASKSAPTLEQRLQEINIQEAKNWDIYLDEARKTKAELIEKPIYLWTNPTKNGGQFGSVFIWAHAGEPVLVGSIFAHPTEGRRHLVHEFHVLSESLIFPECRDGDSQTWQPKGAIKLRPLPGAPAPEASAAKRLIQMRSLGREFGGYTVDWRKQRWELRLLTQPLYRYEKPAGDAIDGALMAMVTSAGTDPEVLLLLEARKNGWHYAPLRFSDSSLYVTHGDKEVWTAVRDKDNLQDNNADFTYRALHKRVLDQSFNTP